MMDCTTFRMHHKKFRHAANIHDESRQGRAGQGMYVKENLDIQGKANAHIQ